MTNLIKTPSTNPLSLLKRTARWAAKSSFYQQKLKQKNISIDSINNMATFFELPPITADDLRNFGKTFPAVPRQEIFGLFASGGTTGKQKLMYWTLEAHQQGAVNLSRHLARLLEPGKSAMMIVPSDNLAIVGDVMRRALRQAKLVSGAMGLIYTDRQLQQMIAVMKEEDPYVLFGSPARLLRLVSEIKNNNTDPAELGVKFVFSASEVLPKKSRKIIEDAFCAKVYEWGGMSEVGSTTIECSERQGQHIITETVFPEVLDLKTGHHVKEGLGELYYTTLINPAYPLVRYKTEDIVKITHKPCKCGLNTPRIWYKSRLSESAKIGRAMLFAYQIDDALADAQEVSQNYRLIIQSGKNSQPHLTFLVEAEKKYNKPQIQHQIEKTLKQKIASLRHEAIVNQLNVKIIASDSLERTPRGKVSDRIKDLRESKKFSN